MNKSSQQGKMLIILIGIVVVVLVGIGAYVWWNSTQQPVITVTLPNGKTATYSDTEANKKFGFKAAETGNQDGSYVVMTHTGYSTFLSTVSSSLLDELCGTKEKPTAKRTDEVGLFRTSDKTVIPPQETTCFSILGSSDNPDAVVREKAASADDAISKDVNDFIANVIIK